VKRFLVRTMLATVALAIWVTPGCRERASVNVIATVGGHRVEIKAFQGYLSYVLEEPWQSVDGRLASGLLDQFLDQEVIAAAARRHRRVDIPVNPGRRSAVVRSLLDGVCGPSPLPDPALVKLEVARRMRQVEPERVRVRQMLLATRAQALAAEKRLRNGEDFVTVSRKMSLAPNAADGGNLGIIAKGTLPPELEHVVFALHAKEISGPVRSPAGYHIFQVLERIPPGHPDLRRTENEVRRDMAAQLRQKHLRACVDRLAGDIGVRVFQNHLWFAYSGRYAEAKHDSKK